MCKALNNNNITHKHTEKMNESNLITMDQRSKSEARELGRAGGIASGKARREKKSMKERVIAAMETTDDDGNECGDIAAARLMMAAMDGDIRAIRLIGDYLGEFKQSIDLTTNNVIEMTKDEARAIYNVGIEKMAEELEAKFDTGTDGPLYRTPLFDEAVKVLGIPSSQQMSDAMNKMQ